MAEVLKKGFKEGLNTTYMLGKVIFPITIIITILRYTAVIKYLAEWLSPYLKCTGLSGNAAIPLLLGNLINLYAGIGAIMSLELTVKEVFILALMLSFAHNIIIESVVASRIGVRIFIILLVRIVLAVGSAILVNEVWQGGTDIAKYAFINNTGIRPDGWINISIYAVKKAFSGAIQIAFIVIPLMIVIQILKDYSFLDKFSNWMSPITRLLGMKSNTSTTLATGLIIGLAYGTGVMAKAVREENVDKKDRYLVFIFLVSCHSAVEDTLLFIPVGIKVWPLLVIRIITATFLTITVGFVWNCIKKIQKKRFEENSKTC